LQMGEEYQETRTRERLRWRGPEACIEDFIYVL
jgi:hypothetical protein